MPVLSIIIPCYNESNRIDLMMNGLLDFENKWNSTYEIIIVNDGSKDDSVKKIETELNGSFEKLKSKTKIISQSNTGKGGALKNGVAAASGDYILTVDADMSALPSDIINWQNIDKTVLKSNEIFIGNRADKNSKIEALAFRKISGKVFTFFVKLFTSLNLNDTQCGFKLYKADVAKHIFSQLKVNGWAHDVEILCRAKLNNIKINEMPLAWKNVDNSHVNVFTDSFGMLWQVLKIATRMRLADIFLSPFQKTNNFMLNKSENKLVAADDLWLEKLNRFSKMIFWVFAFALLIIMPIKSFDSGVTGDEHWHHDYGNAIYNYFFHGDKSILDWKQKENFKKIEESNIYYYGGLVDLWVSICNHKLGWWGDYEMQNFWVSIIGVLGIIITGLLAAELGGWIAALLALLIIALTPTYVGHCFFNPKDAPFSTFGVLALYQLIKFIKQMPKPSTKTSILLTLGIGCAFGVRVGGLLFFIYMWMFVLGYCVIKKETKTWINQKLLIRLLLISIVGYLIGLLCWPYGQSSPIAHPLEALKMMSHFQTNIALLFNGEIIYNTDVPWNYIPVWMSMTTPLIFLIGFIGFFAILFFTKKTYNWYLLIVVAFVGIFPWVYAVKQNSALYDGWRHFLFIYPPLVVLASLFWNFLIQKLKGKMKWLPIGIFVALLILPLKFIAKNHPNEYLYFNEYFGGIQNAYGNFETDYWMTTAKPAFKWLVENEKLADRKDSFSIRTNCVDPIRYYSIEFNNDNKPVHYDVKNGDEGHNFGLTQHRRMFAGYVSIKNRNNNPYNDWDYGIFYTRFVEKELLETPGYFPPPGTIHVESIDGVPLMCVVKRNHRLEKKYNAIADTLMNQNKLDEAIENAKKTLSIYAENTEAISILFNCYLKKKDINAMVNYFTDAIKKYPASDAYYFYLGYGYAISGNKNNAYSYLSKAAELNPSWGQGANQILSQIK